MATLKKKSGGRLWATFESGYRGEKIIKYFASKLKSCISFIVYLFYFSLFWLNIHTSQRDFAATYIILITIFFKGSNEELDVHGTTEDIFYEHQHVDFSQTIQKGIIPATDYQFNVTLEIRYNGLEISDEVSLASENRESKELKIECKSKPPTPDGNYFPSYLVNF